MTLYSIVNGHFAHDSSSLFSACNLSISPGDCFVVTGESGIGKSTLLQLIFGMHTWDSGKERKQSSIHYQPQIDVLLPWKTVFQNLLFFSPGKDINRYAALCGLSDALSKKPAELSQGMKQRVLFLRTLLSGKSLLLFDEPFSNIQSDLKDSMIDLLVKEQRNRAFSSLLVTHDAHVRERLAWKSFAIENGGIVWSQ